MTKVTVGNQSYALNYGARMAEGDILLFFDDDVILRDHCIEELLKPFSAPNVGIVGGVNVAPNNIGWREKVSSCRARVSHKPNEKGLQRPHRIWG